MSPPASKQTTAPKIEQLPSIAAPTKQAHDHAAMGHTHDTPPMAMPMPIPGDTKMMPPLNSGGEMPSGAKPLSEVKRDNMLPPSTGGPLPMMPGGQSGAMSSGPTGTMPLPSAGGPLPMISGESRMAKPEVPGALPLAAGKTAEKPSPAGNSSFSPELPGAPTNSPPGPAPPAVMPAAAAEERIRITSRPARKRGMELQGNTILPGTREVPPAPRRDSAIAIPETVQPAKDRQMNSTGGE
jgi:hypothetical protein